MSNRKSFFIEKLDSGYIATIDDRRVAYTTEPNIEKMLKSELEAMLEILLQASTHNIVVSLEVKENVPKSVNND